MPLSEHEQQVLRQIERQFQVEMGQAQTGWSRPAESPWNPDEDARSVKRSALGFALGLAALLVSFASSWVVGVVGFVAMVMCAVRFVQAARRLLMAHMERLATGLARNYPPAAVPAPTLFAQLRRALWGDGQPLSAPTQPYPGATTGDESEDGPDHTWEA
ncbi:MAG TPA: DUF3040 domain-containing protein [Acidimicrobiales bacterium]|nr:DUF3040 domain-containing protein [Acidimicrobiales bacterium]